MLYWSKYIYHIVVLTEIYCRFTIIDYTTQSFLSLKCVYIFLADPIYIYIQTHVGERIRAPLITYSAIGKVYWPASRFYSRTDPNTHWIGSCLGFGSSPNYVGAKIFSLFRSVRSRLCSGWLLTVRNSCDKRAERSVQYRKPVLKVFECLRRRAWPLLREYHMSEARRHDCSIPKN